MDEFAYMDEEVVFINGLIQMIVPTRSVLVMSSPGPAENPFMQLLQSVSPDPPHETLFEVLNLGSVCAKCDATGEECTHLFCNKAAWKTNTSLRRLKVLMPKRMYDSECRGQARRTEMRLFNLRDVEDLCDRESYKLTPACGVLEEMIFIGFDPNGGADEGSENAVSAIYFNRVTKALMVRIEFLHEFPQSPHDKRLLTPREIACLQGG